MLWFEAQTAHRHRVSVRSAGRLAGQSSLKIQLGCGPRPKSGWVNVDLAPHADLQLDLRELLPFEDGCASVIYAEHFLEHLDYPHPAQQLLSECHRVLEPGGRLRVSLPGVEWHISRYVDGDEAWYRHEKEVGERPDWVLTPLDSLNYLFYMGGEHRYAYDSTTLTSHLLAAGFESAQVSNYDPTLDSEERQHSLFVDAYRRCCARTADDIEHLPAPLALPSPPDEGTPS